MPNLLPRGPKQIIESVNPEVVFDMGAGVVIARHNDTPTSTTLAGVAGTGSILIDAGNGQVYVNAGTADNPDWNELMRQGSG